jgi:hypothetical protein
LLPQRLIRLAMLLGVLTFGGVVWYIRRSGDPPGVSADEARSLLWIGRAIWGVAIIGCIVVFQLTQRRPRDSSYQILAWAFGEMVALYGAVIWFLTGTSGWYVPGLVFLVMTFLAFPARRT